MSKVPISVCIIAKNEEKYIEECLKRLQPYGFEIIVTDTGSTDRTKEIAEKYANKVLDFEWIDDFSAARNFCAANASNNWILALDCDEYVNHIDIRILRILMQKYPRHAGVIRLKNIVLKKEDEMGYGVDDVTRFYNRNYYTFLSPVHEQITIKEESKRDDPLNCFLMPMEVIHHGYALNAEDMRIKQERNLKLLYGEIEKGTNDPYIYFQAGQSEFILRNLEKAIDLFNKGLAMNPSIDKMFVQVMVMSLAKAYDMLDRDEEAVAVMERYADGCKTAKYSYTHASILYDNKQFLKALLIYIKTTTLPDVDTLGEDLMRCYEHIIELYTQMGNQEMADLFKGRYEACKKEKERVINS